MADGARQDVLGQKAQAAQRAFEARGMSPTKALRRALSRTADVLWDLALVAQNVHLEMHDQDGVIDGLSGSDLLVVLDGPDGALGLASLDRAVMTALIEVQTIQQVTQLPVDEDRVLTPTDAAMAAPLLDGTLERMAEALHDSPLRAQLQGYRFGALLEDPRAASLLLDAAAYRVFRAEADLALGRRRGTVSFILPDLKRPPADRTQAQGDGPGPHADLLARVPARLDAVLSRITLPLSRAGALKPGDVLKLSPDALDRVEVLAGRNHLVAKGRLGQLNGLRAVRLTWPVLGPAPVAAAGVPQAADALGDPSAQTELPALPAEEATLPDLPQLPAVAEGAGAGEDLGEALPDLPPMDFGAEPGDFDIGGFGTDDVEPATDLEDGFAAAPLEFDFNE
jgi:flagellar motor switch protein FliM